jgi:S1-C subfamily serine protease
LISTVHEGSPADKGGLMREDVVVRFGGAKVTDFNSLTALISERDAGDEVEVEVLRRTLDDQGNQVLRNVTLKVTLAPWQLDLAVRNGPRP